MRLFASLLIILWFWHPPLPSTWFSLLFLPLWDPGVMVIPKLHQNRVILRASIIFKWNISIPLLYIHNMYRKMLEICILIPNYHFYPQSQKTLAHFFFATEDEKKSIPYSDRLFRRQKNSVLSKTRNYPFIAHS
jgi:hypothetical protein